MDSEHKMEVALWRFGVLGPLVSAHREHGDVQRLLRQAAAQAYERWDGRVVRLQIRTLEDWYYAYRKTGLGGLKPRDRSDSGRSRAIAPELAELILRAKQERPRRSVRRIIKMLERARKVARGRLKRSSVHRLLQAHGISEQPERHLDERRSFRAARAGDLCMGDVMHGPKVLVGRGRLRKSYLHLFIDSATRFVPSCGFRLGETAVDHEAILKQGFLKHGLPRVLYEDRGAAQMSRSLRIICAELSVRLAHCKPYDAPAKGCVERIFRTIRAELLDELPGEPIDLAALNGHLWSWVSAEYHRRIHQGTGKVPLEHWLSQASELRPAPRGEVLDRIFLHRAHRKVRKDGTVRFAGRLLEVRPELCGLNVELRYDPEQPHGLPEVYVDSEFYCDTVELDVVRNSNRLRRRKGSAPQARKARAKSGLDPLRQIQDEHERRSRPPAKGKTPGGPRKTNNDEKE